MNFGDALRRYVTVSDEQVARLEAHYRLLVAWNRRLNLTRVTELEIAARKHYAESVFLAQRLPESLRTVADIGSGAGLPGIPIAVVRPEIDMTLIESDQRKAVFLREASAGLANVRVVAARAETLGDQFECLVSRAVAPEEIADLVPGLSTQAWMLLSADSLRSTWNIQERLPWDPGSAVAFHTEHFDAACRSAERVV